MVHEELSFLLGLWKMRANCSDGTEWEGELTHNKGRMIQEGPDDGLCVVGKKACLRPGLD